jgi:6-pyruvoyltetrahydropterin/6-carboxytetrahydropterin synthase
MFEISVTRIFAAAHAIRLPDGTREPVHGHNWTLVVAVAADKLDAIETVMDFHALEALVEEAIARWHNANLDACEPFVGPNGRNSTAEAVAHHVGERVAARLPAHVRLRYASVTEAPGCTATWRP